MCDHTARRAVPRVLFSLAARNPCLWMAWSRDDMGFFRDAATEEEVP